MEPRAQCHAVECGSCDEIDEENEILFVIQHWKANSVSRTYEFLLLACKYSAPTSVNVM